MSEVIDRYLLEHWDFKFVNLPLKGFIITECPCGCGKRRLYKEISKYLVLRIDAGSKELLGIQETLN